LYIYNRPINTYTAALQEAMCSLQMWDTIIPKKAHVVDIDA